MLLVVYLFQVERHSGERLFLSSAPIARKLPGTILLGASKVFQRETVKDLLPRVKLVSDEPARVRQRCFFGKF